MPSESHSMSPKISRIQAAQEATRKDKVSNVDRIYIQYRACNDPGAPSKQGVLLVTRLWWTKSACTGTSFEVTLRPCLRS